MVLWMFKIHDHETDFSTRWHAMPGSLSPKEGRPSQASTPVLMDFFGHASSDDGRFQRDIAGLEPLQFRTVEAQHGVLGVEGRHAVLAWEGGQEIKRLLLKFSDPSRC